MDILETIIIEYFNWNVEEKFISFIFVNYLMGSEFCGCNNNISPGNEANMVIKYYLYYLLYKY